MAERIGDWMQTASGRQFWPLNPRPEDLAIEDIAAALGKLCRYNGHCRHFYSVAEHSVLLASVAPPELALTALMHDASEAYLADVPRPLKRSLGAVYADAEDRVMEAVAARWGIRWPLPPEVKRLDEAILADERIQAMAPPPAPWREREPPLGIRLRFWTPAGATSKFEAAWRVLTCGDAYAQDILWHLEQIALPLFGDPARMPPGYEPRP